MIRHLPTVLAVCTLACAAAAYWNADQGRPDLAIGWAWVATNAALWTAIAYRIIPGSSDE